MALKQANRVSESATASGIGSFTLQGASAAHRAFSAVFNTGDKVAYTAVQGSVWEIGYGTLTSSTTLTRDVVWDTSAATGVNSGNTAYVSKVSFAGGTAITITNAVSNNVVLAADDGGHLVEATPFRAAVFLAAVDDMQALEDLSDGETVIVTGADGGIFRWDAASVLTADGIDIFENDNETTGRHVRVSNLMKGGYRTGVADITARNAIPAGHREEGMRVKVLSDGKTYELGAGLTNSDWTDHEAALPLSTAQAAAIGALGNFASKALAEAAMIEAAASTVLTNGFYAAGDGGGSTYRRVVSAPSHPGYFQSADGAYWEMSDVALNAKAFGAKGNESQDDAPFLQDAFEAAAYLGRPLFIPAGRYAKNSAIALTSHITVYGAGGAAGPGEISSARITALIDNYSGDCLKITSKYASHISKIQFNAYSQKTSGDGIGLWGPNISGTQYTQSSTVIEDCVFDNQFNCIREYWCAQIVKRANYFQGWKNYAWSNEGGAGIEIGGGVLDGNKFQGYTTAILTNQAGAILLKSGYCDIINNVAVGSQYFLQIAVDNHAIAGVNVSGNKIEEQGVKCIVVSGTSPHTFKDLAIIGNEFKVIEPNITPLNEGIIEVANPGYQFLSGFVISGNTMNIPLQNATLGIFCNIQSGTKGIITGNQIDGIAAAAHIYGFVFGAGIAGPIECLDNVLSNVTAANRYVGASTIVTIRDQASAFTVANLPACANGSLIWSADADPDIPAATGSSMGTWCARRSGVWYTLPIGLSSAVVTAALGYTAANKAGETFTGDLIMNIAGRGKMRFTHTGGYGYIQFGDDDPDTSGGKGHLTGYYGSKLDELKFSAAFADFSDEIRIAGNMALSGVQTGWGAPSGTLSRAAYAAYAGKTYTAAPTQSDMQDLDNAVKLLSQTVAALVTDLKAGKMPRT
ncbi:MULTISPECIES: glycosyl hydrolase family 28-related protein [Asticcacaulis]|uniref:glycosyl hydrolase family 28-related protein n=1 Tax=Asticcacaulis TaxID=76890 RepID=UPI001AE6BEA2|nr:MULTISPECIES: glycosyl hydrolase family 28-related protein [Asticcacaulis]MBP2160251.1 hypothetical protein [Asticcacaulis solisilvae]MDR6801446.1 hypothetical protein [Asticcacaulis sp. BE141]